MSKWNSESQMNPKLKAKWIEALRSGKYKQTQEYLERLDDDGKVVGNCCLGVLCRIAKLEVHEDSRNTEFFDSEGYGSETELTENMRYKFGISEEDQQELIRRNDGTRNGQPSAKPHSFTRIADFIEKNIGVKTTKKKAA